ncbi:hypothetical protein VTL71DRAFT_10555, partial [Oculimacula yallundae]
MLPWQACSSHQIPCKITFSKLSDSLDQIQGLRILKIDPCSVGQQSTFNCSDENTPPHVDAPLFFLILRAFLLRLTFRNVFNFLKALFQTSNFILARVSLGG